MKADFERPLKPEGNTDIEAGYNAIFSTFGELMPNIPAKLYDRFREVTFPVSFKQYQIILDYGQTCKHAYFALSGLVRLSRILIRRGETTVMFLASGDILLSPKSFYTQSISIEKLTALTETFCIALPYSELQSFYKDFIEVNVIARLLTEKYYSQALDRATWFYESPEIRYANLLGAYPEIASHVSVKEVSSYLGIARETLSRIRHRMANKK